MYMFSVFNRIVCHVISRLPHLRVLIPVGIKYINLIYIYNGIVPINDMQVPLTPLNVAKLGFCSKKLRNLLKPVKNNFLIFIF